jgi:hypothetical protein
MTGCFDLLISAFNFRQSQGPIHGGTCDCKPDSTLKIQFLRVVHNMCDNTKDARLRRLLHSTHEAARLRELHGMHGDGRGALLTNAILLIA